MKKCILLLIFVISCNLSHAQKQAHIWYFGEGAGLDFSSGSPVPIAGGQIYGAPQNSNENNYTEGTSTISDSSGGLLFYSNGETVWDKNHQAMPNGTGLLGMYSSTHSSFIVPKPSNVVSGEGPQTADSIFYIFTTDGLERNIANGLRYSVIDMCLHNGLGDVIPGQKNILLLNTVSEKLAGINHANGIDIWLIAHKYNSDSFYAYRVTPSGITNPVISKVGSVHSGIGYSSSIGQMKPSSNGERLALVIGNRNPTLVEVFNFNKLTGVISNPISLSTNNTEYGIEFSPDNTKLYTSSLSGIAQYDLSMGSQAAINASKNTISSFGCIPAGLQLGPDDKIYVSRCGNYIAAINNPNQLGAASNFVDTAVVFGSIQAKLSFPSFINGFDYKNTTHSCPPLIGTSLQYINEVPHRLYPNPAHEYIIIDLERTSLKGYTIQFFDIRGARLKELRSCKEESVRIDTKEFKAGVYFVQITDNTNAKKVVQKIILE